ncbi:MAG: hypothetical protein ACOZJZ_25360 [Pseudomonadota bacterium]
MRHRHTAAVPTHALRLLGASLLLAGGALAVQPARAGLSPLSDVELAQVSGRAAAPMQQQKTEQNSARLPLLGSLLALFAPEHLHTSTLDRAAFEAALAAHGAQPLPRPLYDGGPVTQIVIDAPPVSTRFEAGALLSTFGVDYQGRSFGSISITNLDARGTTLWVWKP